MQTTDRERFERATRVLVSTHSDALGTEGAIRERALKIIESLLKNDQLDKLREDGNDST